MDKGEVHIHPVKTGHNGGHGKEDGEDGQDPHGFVQVVVQDVVIGVGEAVEDLPGEFRHFHELLGFNDSVVQLLNINPIQAFKERG